MKLSCISIGNMESNKLASPKMMMSYDVSRKEGDEMDYLNLPFTQFDSAYLESLPDEVFFAKRFKLSKEDEELLMKNSGLIHGRRFYRAKVREPMMAKYAALTNPKEGEPGSKTNPLVRFGREYVYNDAGDLVPFNRNGWTVLSQSLSEEQKKMVREAAKAPVIYEPDCPKSSPERLQRFMEYGKKKRMAVGE